MSRHTGNNYSGARWAFSQKPDRSKLRVVTIVGYKSIAFEGERFTVWRQYDRRMEANGFLSVAEATQWATEHGWTVEASE